jgi:uncharacterized RDD family membrane protein YckC
MAYAYPGAVPPADPTAVIGRRIGAFFIDAAIAVAAFMIIFFPLATKRTVAETLDLPGCHRNIDQPSQVQCSNRQVVQLGDAVYEADGGPTFGLDLLFALLYFGVLPAFTGATVGKVATGIRVVDANGTIAGIGRSLARWAVFVVDGPFSLFLCGLLTSLLSKGHRRLGDMAAGTFVVNKAAVGQPITAAAAPTYAPAAPAYVPATGGTPQWDAARGAYVQWDPTSGRYLTWDQTAQTWQ